MCGFGILARRDGQTVERAAVTAMAEAVAHRGPDAQGVEVHGPVGLAHRRLAVIDVDHRSDQPLRLGAKHLLFNGAIYNFRELRAELTALGRTFVTEGDSEVLLHALDQWGVDALPRLNGMFALALFDDARQTVLIARDRFGIKPLVYHHGADAFLAGSEAKQLLATGMVSARPDLGAMRVFLETARLNIDDRTLFADIRHLRPGHWIELDRRAWSLRQECWYDLGRRIVPHRPRYADAVAQTRDLLADAVRLRHVANVRVGAALSGGLDSTSIAALSAQVVPDPSAFAVFTTFHDEVGHDERPLARQIAGQYGFHHIEVPVDLPAFLTPERLEQFAFVQDQPLPSGSHFNEQALFRAVRDAGVTVMLDGQGSDEYFGGYGEFWAAAQRAMLRSGRLRQLWANLKGRSARTGDPLWQTFRKLVVVELGREPRTAVLLDGTLARDIPGAEQTGGVLPRDFAPLSLAEMTRLSIPYQLHSQDRFAMASSIESRLPFLDYRLVEYVSGLPIAYRVGNGWQKRLLRDAMPELPDAIRWRRAKDGFSAPDAAFFRDRPDALRAMVADAVAVLARLVDGPAILERFDARVGQPHGYDMAMFRLISLAAWVRAFRVPL